MGNNIWIGLLWLGSFVFAVLACAAIWWGIADKEFWNPFWCFVGMSCFAEQAGKLALSRIKYGPKGHPPDPLENFHIDF